MIEFFSWLQTDYRSEPDGVAPRGSIRLSPKTILNIHTEAYQTLEQRVAERTQAFATLNAIAAMVSRSLDLKEVMGAALDQTLQVVGMDAGVAYQLDDATQNLVLMARQGLSESFAQRMSRLPLQLAHAGHRLKQMGMVAFFDPQNEVIAVLETLTDVRRVRAEGILGNREDPRRTMHGLRTKAAGAIQRHQVPPPEPHRAATDPARLTPDGLADRWGG